MKNLKSLWIPFFATWSVLVFNVIFLIIDLIMHHHPGAKTISGFKDLAILLWTFLIFFLIKNLQISASCNSLIKFFSLFKSDF